MYGLQLVLLYSGMGFILKAAEEKKPFPSTSVAAFLYFFSAVVAPGFFIHYVFKKIPSLLLDFYVPQGCCLILP